MTKIGDTVLYHILDQHQVDHTVVLGPCTCSCDLHIPALVLDVWPAADTKLLTQAQKVLSTALTAWAKSPGDVMLWNGVDTAQQAVKVAEVAAKQPVMLLLDLQFSPEHYVKQEAFWAAAKVQLHLEAARFDDLALSTAARADFLRSQPADEDGEAGDDPAELDLLAKSYAEAAVELTTRAAAVPVRTVVGEHETFGPTVGQLIAKAGELSAADGGQISRQGPSPQATTEPPASGTWTEIK